MQFVKLQLGCLLAIAYIEISYIRATMKGKIPCNPFFDALLAVAPWAVFFDGLTAWTVNHMDIVPEFWNRSAHLLFFLSMDLTVLITTGYIYDRLLGLRNQEKEGLLLGTLSFIVIAGIILAVQVIFPEVLLTSLFPTLLLLGIYMDFEKPFLRKVTMQRDEMVNGFATMVECRDNDTGGHINRTRGYVDPMLGKMRYDRRYRAILNREYLENVSNAAPLHDIGKISTPDDILQKPGRLTDAEFEIMKQHAAIGGDLILHSFRDISNADFRRIAYEVARYHHEKFNGRGYPDGLEGEEIPLHARVMAIADVFDAVSQKRCYRDAIPVEECFAILQKGSGSDFDPNIVRIFLDARREVIALMNAHPAKTE